MTKSKDVPALVGEEVQEIGRDELVAAIQEVFLTPAGAIVLGWLSSRFGFIRRTTHVPGDPHTSALNEGTRLVLVEIGKMLESEPGGTGDTDVAEM